MADELQTAPKPKARDLNQLVRYTMWSVFRVTDRGRAVALLAGLSVPGTTVRLGRAPKWIPMSMEGTPMPMLTCAAAGAAVFSNRSNRIPTSPNHRIRCILS